MSEKHIEELIIRFIEGTCPDEEMRELLDWVRESTEHRDTLFGMKDIYDRSRLRQPQRRFRSGLSDGSGRQKGRSRLCEVSDCGA